MGSENIEDPFQEERERTLYVAGLSDQVNEELLYELFLQVSSEIRQGRALRFD